MRAHILQHVPFEGPGSIADWLLAHGASIATTALYDPAHALPAPADFDLLIAMGGPMSVNDEAACPWLVAEKALVADAVAAGKAVLGVCLGAQLIASALGAAVHANAATEIGWFPVHGIADVPPSAFRFPPVSLAFHWHGETFELPRGAIHLASSEACAHQAFQLGERVLALQFHLETTPASLQSMLQHSSDDLVPGPWIQGAAALAATPADYYDKANALMEQVLTYLTRP